MAKTSDTKIRILAIERILANGQWYTVEAIQQTLEQRYDIRAVDRKTIFDDIIALDRFMPIESKPGRGGGFRRVNVLERCRTYKEE